MSNNIHPHHYLGRGEPGVEQAVQQLLHQVFISAQQGHRVHSQAALQLCSKGTPPTSPVTEAKSLSLPPAVLVRASACKSLPAPAMSTDLLAGAPVAPPRRASLMADCFHGPPG